MAGWQRELGRILARQRIQSLRAIPRNCPVRQETMRLSERPHQVALPSSTLSSDIILPWHRQYGLKKKKKMKGNQGNIEGKIWVWDIFLADVIFLYF